MKTLYHRCGQVLDVAERLANNAASNEFVFLDQLTGDGYDRCPRCECSLRISDFSCQPKRDFSHAKPNRKQPAQREARQLIRRAREIASRQQVAV